MIHKKWFVLGAVLISLSASGCESDPKNASEKTDMQDDVRKMANDTLQRLYTTQPSAKTAVEGAAGYAVFSNFGMKIFVAGGGSGKGIAIDKQTKKETFMRMGEVQVGLGMGVKKFSLVWVFDTRETYDNFVNKGWEFGGQATAAAKAGNEGGATQGALAVAPGIWLYQLTDTGLALELTAKGTKYYQDSGLN
jgi:lipid-binding SYLF domain-containing protein